jgi:TPR repeat protein
VGKNHLETLLNHLRDRPSPITREEFQAMREEITESAHLEILSAMLLLGDNLRKTEMKEAFGWYSKAAATGDRTAEAALGFLLSRGVSPDPPDPNKAFEHFQIAANKGDIGAKFALGQCYRAGAGVAVDLKRAVELFREAADAGDTRAMTDLGDCYVHGEGVNVDMEAAFKLFSKAKEKGNLNAAFDLGVLYMRGEGVAKNPEKAVEIWAEGAEAEDNLPDGSTADDSLCFCMLYYAQCLEAGNGVAQNLNEATKWYAKAAKAGNKKAEDWCKRHLSRAAKGH